MIRTTKGSVNQLQCRIRDTLEHEPELTTTDIARSWMNTREKDVLGNTAQTARLAVSITLAREPPSLLKQEKMVES